MSTRLFDSHRYDLELLYTLIQYNPIEYHYENPWNKLHVSLSFLFSLYASILLR